MKAIVCDKYGPPEVLRIADLPQPAPQDDEVLVEVRAASVNAYDWHLLTADIFLVRIMSQGLSKPKFAIPGADMAGRVVAVGRNVTHFSPGDEVFGDISHGAYAEFACAPENRLARKPANLSFEEAAAVPMAALTALHGLRDEGGIRPGQKVLIQGASGGVGTFALQLAKAFGADVTAVCSPRNLGQAQALGADRVIDYTREDFTQNGQRYDLILAVNGYHPLAAYKRALTPQGRYIMAGGTMRQIFEVTLLGPRLSEVGGRKLGGVPARVDREDLETLRELLEAGQIRPVIDRRYPFEETAEALRYLGTGHARGKVVIQVA
jgi:NADPH:quinone reductase-like Zn-dependent oxidoreductase